MLTIFLTGNELGMLQPCGCSGGQLGGFDRRLAVFETVPASKRLIVDTGLFVEGDSEQDLIKFNIMVQAFNLLNYDLVSLTGEDVETGRNLGLLDSIGSIFNVITSSSSIEVDLPAKFTKQLSLGGRIVAVTVTAFDAESAPIEQISELFTPQPNLQTVNILILNHCDTAVIDSIAEMGIVDCLVCPPESDEPEVVGDPDKRPLVVSIGRFGKYVGRLQIKTAEAKDKLTYSFSSLPVTEDLPQEKSLVELYKAYQQIVKEEKLLEKQPRFVLPNDLEYIGSESCKLCHDYEYEKWNTKSHAHAYATLERVGSEYDPECVLCHVVGAEYEGGFVSKEETGYLKDVGCESCHGPGSEHIRTLGQAKTTGPWLDCTDCHTPERSASYAGNELLYFEKIIHWREPNAVVDVKEGGD
jgi:nitrate/TMAO reductase-like tetraheme cytochrome c subunit